MTDPAAALADVRSRIAQAAKIAGVVEINEPDETKGFAEVSETTARIGRNVAEFLAGEIKRGVVPKGFLPVQSGVGDTANAVLLTLAFRWLG